MLDLGDHPEIDDDDWSLKIDGQVMALFEMDLTALMSFHSISLEVDIHCVTAWSVPGHSGWVLRQKDKFADNVAA